ncbi:hypothetical protein COCC4DRAFT_59806 [Bipolaris maydis ATCC 48331]|uniref:Protein kinase domain-containing protein n=2 Tax=Cochliobolus heterostrophus TaxID=5016 RepID=M2SM40_COCH5|nr:uncharacterized protein COCC4DRAFT_59806 [Bipolaris maydis ATCC 48331]EMD86380.1 hypothetical protein COCHEDRAFT_1034820 [Bipolaris maydis C5]ENI06330.1 hypothetical protein COCC4DRAFT_59806 [Bipolaris maydis ATCC 48331]KAJ6213999.1 hypothetical protein PSV09DRAFT_1034820 [Bipolaris maydis]
MVFAGVASAPSHQKRVTEIRSPDGDKLSANHVKRKRLTREEHWCTDIKLDNVFVNYVQNEQRLSEIQLGDCGGAVSQDSEFVKESYPIGGDFMRSPETMLGLSWGTPTDVWSFGNAILSLVHGGGYHQFDPGYDGVKPEDEKYELIVLQRMVSLFRPIPTNDCRNPQPGRS